ncbi:MAG: phage tail protein [Firmicutes bacterium]|jgi:hypothetical protein|nr:phage tail protein [Bacillota bacterium]
MPLPTASKILLLKDCRIAALTDDSGAEPTYGTSVDLPGIQTLELTPEMDVKTLEGDGEILDVYSKVRLVGFTWNSAKIPLDALAVLLGGTVTESGTTPNQKAVYSLGDENPQWFKIEGQAVYVEDGLGDVHVTLYKCKCTGGAAFSLGTDFAVLKATGQAIRAASNRKLLDVTFNETETPLS